MIMEVLITFGLCFIVMLFLLYLLHVITNYLFDKFSIYVAYAISLALAFSLWYTVMKYID